MTPAKNEPGKVAVTLAAGTKSGGAIEIILDASGSMLQKLGAERRIDIAKQTLTKLTSSTIPAGTPFAFRVFGREVDSCQTDLDVPVAPLNPAAVGQRIAALVAKNGAKTPIGASLDKAADDLKSVTGEKLIVLVTDGEETCGGDPAAAIERLRKAGIGTRVSIVGFALDDREAGHHVPALVGCRRRRVLRRQGCRRPRQVADRSAASWFRSGERAGPGARQRHRRRRRRAGARGQSHRAHQGARECHQARGGEAEGNRERRLLIASS